MLHLIKKAAKRVAPASLLRVLRRSWESVWDWLAVVRLSLYFIIARKLLPKTLLYFGFAPGDDLLCTTVLRELRHRGDTRVLMVSDHPQLFAGNPDPAHVQKLWSRYGRDGSAVSICRRFAWLWGGRFRRIEYAPMEGQDRRRVPSRHIVAEMCARADIAGRIIIRPYLFLTEAEKAAATWARGHIVIQSSGMAARHPMRNKQWFEEHFQEVVEDIGREFDVIQLGSPSDPILEGVKDLRGANTMRESAAILYHARLYIGTVGFLMHLARAVECPSVIVFGGREAPWQSGYISNRNLYSPVPCAPCWRGNICDHDRQCMKNISTTDVTAAIREMLARPRDPLPVETVDIAPAGSG